jgi:hypothetical protein
MEVVMRGDEMRTVNECNDVLLLYISANDSVKNFEKGDGRIVLDNALIFKK